MVVRNPAMLLPMLFGWLAAFYNAPEGVAAPLAGSLGGGAAEVGALLAAQAFGETAGMLAFGRLVPPASRLRLMGPLAIATCAVLVAFAAKPALPAALMILAVSGAFGAYQIAANAAFVRAVPEARRARAFGLAQGGMSLGQGTMMVLAGAAAQRFAPSEVIAVAGAVGAVCAACVAASWKRSRKADAPGGLPTFASRQVRPHAAADQSLSSGPARGHCRPPSRSCCWWSSPWWSQLQLVVMSALPLVRDLVCCPSGVNSNWWSCRSSCPVLPFAECAAWCSCC
jgi:hypothetical protein